jgi:hypothetical protein
LARRDGHLGVADERGTLRRIVHDVDGAAADHGTADGACAQFCESHLYRHS